MALASQIPTNRGPSSASDNFHHLIGGPEGVGIVLLPLSQYGLETAKTFKTEAESLE